MLIVIFSVVYTSSENITKDNFLPSVLLCLQASLEVKAVLVLNYARYQKSWSETVLSHSPISQCLFFITGTSRLSEYGMF